MNLEVSKKDTGFLEFQQKLYYKLGLKTKLAIDEARLGGDIDLEGHLSDLAGYRLTTQDWVARPDHAISDGADFVNELI